MCNKCVSDGGASFASVASKGFCCSGCSRRVVSFRQARPAQRGTSDLASCAAGQRTNAQKARTKGGDPSRSIFYRNKRHTNSYDHGGTPLTAVIPPVQVVRRTRSSQDSALRRRYRATGTHCRTHDTCRQRRTMHSQRSRVLYHGCPPPPRSVAPSAIAASNKCAFP